MSMWSKEMVDNRNRVLARIEMLKALPKEIAGTFLHLGCGPQIYEGWVNIDKFHDDPRVEKYDMYRLPYDDASVNGIYSSHSLEHLPFRRARAALVEWARVLAPQGRLFLAIPDLETIMRVLLDENVPENLKWDWFIYTMYGWQVDTSYRGNDPDWALDLGQFHYCGFTMKSIRSFLEQAGLTVKLIFTYDGWDTPSLWVEATK